MLALGAERDTTGISQLPLISRRAVNEIALIVIKTYGSAHMRLVLLLVITLIGTGCAGKAVMIQAPYPYAKFTPSNTSELGIIRYDLTGTTAIDESGRISAYRLMQSACRGSYSIVGQPFNWFGWHARHYQGYRRFEPPTSTVQNAENPTELKQYFHFRCDPPRDF